MPLRILHVHHYRVTHTRATFEVLLVEDNPGDVRLTEEALKESGLPVRLSVATDGEDAMDFLRRRGVHGRAPRPNLVLLDLNLPRRSGHEVLADMKQDPAIRDIPVVVLTTSNAEDDVRESYARHASSFVTKPVDFDRFIATVQEIGHYWFDLVRLPGTDAAAASG